MSAQGTNAKNGSQVNRFKTRPFNPEEIKGWLSPKVCNATGEYLIEDLYLNKAEGTWSGRITHIPFTWELDGSFYKGKQHIYDLRFVVEEVEVAFYVYRRLSDDNHFVSSYSPDHYIIDDVKLIDTFTKKYPV